MKKHLIFGLLVFTLLLSSTSFAAGGRGLCSDYFSKGLFKITSRYTFALRGDQYGVKGQLDYMADWGMTGWVVKEQSYIEKNVYRNPFNAFHFLEKGDRLYVLDSKGEAILFEGFYGSVEIASSHGGKITKPVLFRDPFFKDVVISEADFAKYFVNGQYQAVVIKLKRTPHNEYQREALRESLEDLLNYTFHQFNPNRFVKITDDVIHELGPNQYIIALRGSVSYETSNGFPIATYILGRVGGKATYRFNLLGQGYIVSPQGKVIFSGRFPESDPKQMGELIKPENTIHLIVSIN